MDASHTKLRLKTCVFSAVVILTNVLGNFFLSLGLRGGTLASESPLAYIKVMFSPWVAAGIILLSVWMLSRMTLLSWADLSFVLPVTSLGYVVSALMARIFLKEQITGQRWFGTLLIVAGTALVGMTGPRTTPSSGKADTA